MDKITTTNSRRSFLKNSMATLAAGGLATQAVAALPATRQRVLRLAHITDVHVQPELGAGDGLIQCLRNLHAQYDDVDLVINTGDSVMDCLSHDAQRVNRIWDLWSSILSAELHCPIRHCIGNHDIWGWDEKGSKTTGTEPGWGKALAMKRLGLDRSYYSFDQAGWHFVALDTVQPLGDGYHAHLDDEQFLWLGKDLAAVDRNTPVLIFSHIPIIGVAPLLNDDASATGNFVVPGSKIVLDNVRIKNLFKQSPNLRLCISGHIHLLDQVEYLGVKYCCGGAVCGDYWKGLRNGECDAGYSIIDLYNDGSSDRTYHTYGWVYHT